MWTHRAPPGGLYVVAAAAGQRAMQLHFSVGAPVPIPAQPAGQSVAEALAL